jgi:hypothetical protein
LGGQDGSLGERTSLDGNGVACILVVASEGEADWVVDSGGEGGSVSWSGGNPNWGIVGYNNIGELHQKVNHDIALSVADNDCSVVETVWESDIVPRIESSICIDTCSSWVAGSCPFKSIGESVSQSVSIGVDGSDLEGCRCGSSDNDDWQNIGDGRSVIWVGSKVNIGERSHVSISVVSQGAQSATH